ncbi:hypothetical protein ANN_14402, partial [Periplaneta americana]
NCKPLEELKVVITKDGVTKEVPALSPGWREERQHVYYKPPPTVEPDGSFPIGAKEAWLERMEFLNSDLSWLLELQQYRFWSQLLYHEETLNMILSFLQEAPPYYAIEEFPQDEEMWNSFQRTHYLMFLLINRLATYKESETEFISPGYLGKLIYDYYVFTIPMILDICMFYGRENRCHVLKIINTVFNIQPQYQEDLKKSVPFICKVLRFVEHKFGGRKLPEGELVKLSERPDRREEMTLLEFKDLVLHMLDTAANLSLFLDIYTPACKVFHQQLFEMKIVHFYENTVPQMYRKLELLANKDDTQPVYVDLKHKLDIMRVELLKVFRLCLATCINPILENIDTVTEAEVKKYVDDYVGVLTECLSEKVFIRDYHSAYPVDHDLDALSQVCPEMYPLLTLYLLMAFKEPENGNLPVGGSGESAHKVPPKKRVTGIELESLITEVKDILPHLGDGFVELEANDRVFVYLVNKAVHIFQKCLEQFNFASDSVINAILEDTLPLDLRSSDQTLPRIPPDTKGLPLGKYAEQLYSFTPASSSLLQNTFDLCTDTLSLSTAVTG